MSTLPSLTIFVMSSASKMDRPTTNGDVKARKFPDLYYTKVDKESENTPEETIPDVMLRNAREKADFPIMMSKSKSNYEFDLTITMSNYVDLAKAAAKSFIKLGLEAKGAVGIIGFNHAWWCISQFGSIFAGAAACGIYTTNSAEVCEFIINDCNIQIMVVEDSVHLAKILTVLDECPQVKAIVQYTGNVSDDQRRGSTVPIYSWNGFMDLGSGEDNEVLDSRTRSIKPRDVALYVYTSGTTGMPKGVMLSHDNMIWASKMAFVTVNLRPYHHTIISYLPFSHVAANLVDVVAPITVGFTVYFAQPDALKGSLAQTLKEVRPTVFLGVPRVFEKIQEQMQEIGAQVGCFKRHVGSWAKKVGHRNSLASESGKSKDFSYKIANCLVFSKVKKALGLDRCEYIMCGAAPISQPTLDYFLSLDLMIHLVYGMSETSGPHSLGCPHKIKIGTVGLLMKGTEMKIADPDENGVGEICMRGRHVFLGYQNSEEKTKEVIDIDGWLHSGDLGKVENNLFLRITGRIKEIIITAGGENVAPLPVEDTIKDRLPFISNVMLVGDNRKYISCLLTLKTVMNLETQEPTNMLTSSAMRSLKEIGIEASSVEEVLNRDDLILTKKIDEVIKEVNKRSVSRAAFVQKWSFLPRDFSISGGELGPTMKLKRYVISEMYAEEIEKMYA